MQDRDSRAAEIAVNFPDDHKLLRGLAKILVREGEKAILAGQIEKACRVWEEREAMIYKLNGNTFFASRCEGGGYSIFEDFAGVEFGTNPAWMQRGEFVVEVDDVQALVVYEPGSHMGDFHFSFYAINEKRMFFSETGYRSCFFRNAEGTVEDKARATVKGLIRECGLKKIQPAPHRNIGGVFNGRPWLEAYRSSVSEQYFIEANGQMSMF